MTKDPRIVYIAHGRAGLEVARLLLDELGVRSEQILAFSYTLEESRPLCEFLKNRGIPVSFESIRSASAQSAVENFKPDLVVSMHARELIPGRVLSSAKLGGMNLHPSLLPKYRGCLSGVWAIVNQETSTGISYHFMNDKFDDGRIILQRPVQIMKDETGFTIFNKLIDVGVAHFKEAFLSALSGSKGDVQIGDPTYYPRDLPFSGRIDPNWNESKIDAFIRALYFPGRKGAVVKTIDGDREVLTLADYLALKSSRKIS